MVNIYNIYDTLLFLDVCLFSVIFELTRARYLMHTYVSVSLKMCTGTKSKVNRVYYESSLKYLAVSIQFKLHLDYIYFNLASDFKFTVNLI